MEALAAFGVAANVVQFVDLASKLLSTARGLYNSSTGHTQEQQELQNVTRLIRQQLQLSSESHVKTESVPTDEDELLRDLGKRCVDLSDEILAELDRLRVKHPENIWSSVHLAIRGMRRNDYIQGLQLRLERISSHLTTTTFLKQQEAIMRRMGVLNEQNYMLHASRGADISQLRTSFAQLFARLPRSAEITASVSETIGQLSKNTQIGLDFQKEQRILSLLVFAGMTDRYSIIHHAHSQTLSWIFQGTAESRESNGSSLVDWLAADNESLFWVSGKPGSGKSTCMKYISRHDHLGEHLKAWGCGNSVIVASFFFWNGGKQSLLKSQEGLLRSIVYQILRQRPDLTRAAFPELWDLYSLSNSGSLPPETTAQFITVSHLLVAVQNLCSPLAGSPLKFCFLIDGLDEYEGRPEDVIRLVQVLKMSPNIKTCVSSRPWNEFEAVFGRDNPWKLYMQDLTRGDIEAYIRDTLERDLSFQELAEEYDGASGLVDEIVENANGVFLWVYLVVRSLLEGLTNADRISDLRRRVRSLPSDLNQYFESILFTVDNFYRDQTAQFFVAALEAQTALPLMCYWYMDQEDLDLAVKQDVGAVSMQRTTKRLKQIEKRLNACCKGLLEPQFYHSDDARENSLPSSVLFNWKVDFLHRTVRDYLRTSDMQNALNAWGGDSIGVDSSIAGSILALVKTSVEEEEYWQGSGPIERLLAAFKFHIKEPVANAEETLRMQAFEVEMNRICELGRSRHHRSLDV